MAKKMLVMKGATRANAKDMRDVLEEHMCTLPVKDTEVVIGNCKYDPITSELTYKVTIKMPTESGSRAPSKLELAFEQHKNWQENSIKEHNVGDVFVSQGSRFKLLGWNNSAPARPIQAERLCGKGGRSVKAGATFVFRTSFFNHATWEK